MVTSQLDHMAFRTHLQGDTTNRLAAITESCPRHRQVLRKQSISCYVRANLKGVYQQFVWHRVNIYDRITKTAAAIYNEC